jgi:hypothetical protein
MAPARMIGFIKEHAADCDICRKDLDLEEEIEKITEMILPESKIPKAVRMQQEQEELAKQAAENDAAEDEADSDDEDDTEEEDDKEVKTDGEKPTD